MFGDDLLQSIRVHRLDVEQFQRKHPHCRTLALDVRTGRRHFAFPDGRYSPAVAIDDRLVLTGVHTLYGFAPR